GANAAPRSPRSDDGRAARAVRRRAPAASPAAPPRGRAHHRCPRGARFRGRRDGGAPRAGRRRLAAARVMSHEPSFRTLRLERSGDRHVLTVLLHRPEVLNAMNTAMGEDLLACFRGPAVASDVRAVVFTGAGDRAFCVGGDLKEREGMSDGTWRAQHVIFEQAAMAILRCPAPVIAAVEGFAFGGGCELALLSDFIVASESAVFALPEVTRGIFPGVGGTQLLPRIVGAPLAKELVFTGRRVEAPEARTVGLVNHVVPRGQARARATELAATI